jgi:predicted protein tyrosine phosphatase
MLSFFDVEEPDSHFPGPTFDHVRKIIDFMAEAPYPMMVHCEAGISRSAAATMIGYYLMCGEAKEAARRMYDARDGPERTYVKPNRLMLAHADRLLASRLQKAA